MGRRPDRLEHSPCMPHQYSACTHGCLLLPPAALEPLTNRFFTRVVPSASAAMSKILLESDLEPGSFTCPEISLTGCTVSGAVPTRVGQSMKLQIRHSTSIVAATASCAAHPYERRSPRRRQPSAAIRYPGAPIG